MLKRWREKYGSGATYQCLADSLQKSEEADLIYKIRALLTGTKITTKMDKRHVRTTCTLT